MARHLGILLAVLLATVCGRKSPPSKSEEAPSKDVANIDAGAVVKLDSKHLPNAIRLNARVISGGLPEGDEAFAELADMGVKTIVSVDGAKPDVERARSFGLRYVHLPHGYDGIAAKRASELAKATRDLPGPIYIHCHHGKHRSPAAASVACVSIGLTRREDASAILKLAGTSENYRGLYQSVAEAKRLDDALLDELRVEFTESVELPPLAQTMVDIDRIFERLKSLSVKNWRPPGDAAELDPAHEALLLREQYVELARMDAAKKSGEEFLRLVSEGEQAAEALESALRDWKAKGSGEPIPTAIPSAFERATKNCATCHRQVRDIPLSEKANR